MKIFNICLSIILFCLTFQLAAQNTTLVFTSSANYTPRAGVTSIVVEMWGGGGGGASGSGVAGGGGGGGGSYSKSTVAVTAGTQYTVTVGLGGTAGNDGGTSSFGSSTVTANGGKKGTTGGAGGAGGTAGTGTTTHTGGSGASNVTTTGGGGGGGAGTTANGGSTASSFGGTGGSSNGQNGGNAGGAGSNGNAPTAISGFYGGGGGGAGQSGTGGTGGNGAVIITVISTCPTIPAAPSCPAGGSTIAANGDLGSAAVNYTISNSQNPGPNISSGGPGVNIYVCSGGTLTVSNDFSPTAGTNVYILAGGSLSIGGNVNGGNIYVYGTLTTAGVSLQNANSNIYVASSGNWNASAATINMNGGASVVVEGSANLNNLNQFQNAATIFCINNNGCVQFNSISSSALQVDNGFMSDNGVGVIYWKNTTCPSISNNHVMTTSPGMRICSAENPGPCAFWGSATVQYNCVPGSSGSTSANCAGAVALPITLVSFSAKQASEGVKIKWNTALEINTDYFLIEKSTNGIEWTEIAEVNAIGSKKGQNYSATDYSPSAGYNYYRLTEVEKDGKQTPYAVDIVDITDDGVDFHVFPNPSTGNITVTVSSDFPHYELEIEDVKGVIIGTYTLLPGANSLTNVAKPGVYFAKLKVGTDMKIQKIVVQ